MIFYYSFLITVFLAFPCCDTAQTIPTKGMVWPMPQSQTKNESYHVFKSITKSFYFTKVYHTCDILEKGIDRILVASTAKYHKNVVYFNAEENHKKDKGTKKIEFKIELTKPCENNPYLEMNEAYKLNVGENGVVLTSDSIWGILRGLITFDQSIYFSYDYTELRVDYTDIEDYPAYKHRGLLIDTSRHYLNIETINSVIDSMEMNKMNVLHWHIIDDESFPYQTDRYPSMSELGAYHKTMIYSGRDIQQIVERARLAGIRVIPEFDIPGHVRSWGVAFPILLTQCYANGKKTRLGPLNPIKNSTYMLLQDLLQEAVERFSDEYIHLGGDEIDTQCWLSNPEIQEYMKTRNYVNVNMLLTEFMSNVGSLLPQKVTCILWQEIFDSGVPLTDETIIQVWKYNWVNKMDEILSAHHRVIFSSAWYLDALGDSWEKFYVQDPRQMVFSKRLNSTGLEAVIGGEACMWGEKVDDSNILSRIWPRTSAVAERLWSGTDYKSSVPPVSDLTRRRLEEHACRMRRMGIPVEPPNGAGFCLGSIPRPAIQHRSISRRRRDRHNRHSRFYY